jgi:hypothetical protein
MHFLGVRVLRENFQHLGFGLKILKLKIWGMVFKIRVRRMAFFYHYKSSPRNSIHHHRRLFNCTKNMPPKNLISFDLIEFN